MANTTKTETTIEMRARCAKTKPVLSKAWAEWSPPQRKERLRRNEEELGRGRGVGRGGGEGGVGRGGTGGGFKLDEAKIRATGKV